MGTSVTGTSLGKIGLEDAPTFLGLEKELEMGGGRALAGSLLRWLRAGGAGFVCNICNIRTDGSLRSESGTFILSYLIFKSCETAL